VQGLVASGSGLEVQSSPAQQLETDSVPKENGPVQEEAQSTAEVVDNSQSASM
jgi:hypothetical protein